MEIRIFLSKKPKMLEKNYFEKKIVLKFKKRSGKNYFLNVLEPATCGVFHCGDNTNAFYNGFS